MPGAQAQGAATALIGRSGPAGPAQFVAGSFRGLRGPAVREFAKYFLACLVALGVDWGLLVLLTAVAGWNYLVSAAVGYSSGVVVGYVLSVHFVFAHRRIADVRLEFPLFVATGSLGLGLTQVLLYGIVEFTGLNYALAKAPAAATVFGVTFIVRRVLLFSAGTIRLPNAAPVPVAWFGRHALTVAAACSLLAAWLFTHPYLGIIGDARIYVGRALADLDPQGIGRDLMFVNDGQSGFSLYTRVLDPLVAVLGASDAARLLAGAGLVVWLAAAFCLVRAFAAGRNAWTMLVFLAALPSVYGGFAAFHYAETEAVPRPLAEALVLFGVAVFVRGRALPALALMLGAALIHPIMAVAGLAVVLLAAAYRDRRWAALIVAGLVGVLIAAGLGVPVAVRLFTPVDAAWRSVAAVRSANLFPTLWPAPVWVSIAAEAATVIVAAAYVGERVRLVLLAALATSLAGIGITLVLGDWAGSLLVLQAQPWRVQWLLAVLAAAMLALVVLGASQRRPVEKVVAALLCTAWVPGEPALAAAGMAVLALFVHVARARLTTSVRPFVLTLSWAMFALAVVGSSVSAGKALLLLFIGKPADAAPDADILLAFGLHVVPLCALAVLIVTRPLRNGAILLAAATLASALLALSLGFWDARSSFRRLVDDGDRRSDLPALLATRSGEVLWLDDAIGGWQLAHRANYVAGAQGASSIFSRPLAIAWDERLRRAIAAGLLTDYIRAPFTMPVPPLSLELPPLTHIQRFCAVSDAPAWIVAPIASDATLDAGLAAQIWRAPAPQFRLSVENDRFVWKRFDRYAVFPCAATDRPAPLSAVGSSG